MSGAGTCTWQASDRDEWGDLWSTACEPDQGPFMFTEGGPAENGFSYCPYCGRPLHVIEPAPDTPSP